MFIAFHNPQLDIRGTCVALYDYAKYNEDILGNKSIIVSNKIDDIRAFRKFSTRFPVFIYNNTQELHSYLTKQKIDLLYAIKYGKKDDIMFDDIPLAVHCVFDLSEPHGRSYASISDALSEKYSNKFPVVPHMISLEPSYSKQNRREELNIPEDSVVFGRYGGEDTFNIPFCHKVIHEIVLRNPNIYFLFANTPKFCPPHSQIIFVNSIISDEDKNRFICTCDAHLECGTLGHSFGLAIGEFSVNNKPVIAFKHPTLWNTAHLQILGDKGIYFTNETEFRDILLNFKKNEWENKDNNCYKQFSPKNVMSIFKKVFLTN